MSISRKKNHLTSTHGFVIIQSNAKSQATVATPGTHGHPLKRDKVEHVAQDSWPLPHIHVKAKCYHTAVFVPLFASFGSPSSSLLPLLFISCTFYSIDSWSLPGIQSQFCFLTLPLSL